MRGFLSPHLSMDALIFLLFVIAAGALSLGTALSLQRSISRFQTGTDKMEEVTAGIRRATLAFVQKQWSVIVLCTILSALALSFVLEEKNTPLLIGHFVVGSFATILVSFLGLRSALTANVRVAASAMGHPRDALRITLLSGTVLSLSVMGITVLLIAGSVLILGVIAEENVLSAPAILLGLLLGSISTALFLRIGGGIAAKAADIAADHTEAEGEHRENDPRNPASIVDHAGDNISGIAGAGADLSASFTASIVLAMFLGSRLIGTQSAVFFPLMIASSGVLAGIVSTMWIGRKGGRLTIRMLLRFSSVFTSLLILAATIFFAKQFFPETLERSMALAAASGIALGIVITGLAEYYASPLRRPGRAAAQGAEAGGATHLLLGMAWGAVATGPSLLCIALCISIAYLAAGPYGLALAAVGMLSTLSIPLAGGAAVPVLDNAYGIASMSGLPEGVQRTTRDLHATGSIAGARGRGFALVSSFLIGLTLFAAFGEVLHLSSINLLHPLVLIGLFMGSLLPFLFSSMTMNAVGRATHALIAEVRKSLKRKSSGNPSRCIAITTSTALQEMVTPGLLAIVAPVSVGFLLGVNVLAGLLAGALSTGLLLALFFLFTGSVLHAAKAAIDKGNIAAKKNGRYRIALLGDAFGDPLKDAIGPSLLLFVELMLVIALLTGTLYPASGLL